jgi:hypothetical protein
VWRKYRWKYDYIATIKRDGPMQHPDPGQDQNRCPHRTLDRAYIAIQLAEARAAARTLYELYPDPRGVEPLYRALEHALDEVARAVDTAEDRRADMGTATEGGTR